MQTYTVGLDSEALADLELIRAYIEAQSGAQAAEKFLARIQTHLRGFDIAPQRGEPRDDLFLGLRLVGWKRTLTIAMVVDVTARHVEVVAIFYRGRDVETALKR